MNARLCRLLLPLVALACTEEAPSTPSTPSVGPPGGLIEIDPSRIPIGDNAGGSGGTGGAGSAGAAGKNTSDGGGSGTMGGISGSAGSGTAGAGSTNVGMPCDSDEGCDAPLSCRSDTDSYVAHKQCTMPCDAAGECESEFGVEASFCILAGICVRTCTSDDDCSPATPCNDSGWCERGGPGSGVPYCDGVATPCALLETLDCVSAGGCKRETACTGLARSCLEYSTEFLCTRHQGCSWISDSCTGSAHACDRFDGLSTCTSQDGCTWEDRCTGIPDDCPSIPLQLCDLQPGCLILD